MRRKLAIFILAILVVVPILAIATKKYIAEFTVVYPNETVRNETFAVFIADEGIAAGTPIADRVLSLDEAKTSYEIVVEEDNIVETRTIELQLICSDKTIYGALDPGELHLYNIAGTTSICADISWLPSDRYIWLGLLDEDTSILKLYRFSGGSVTWCPSTTGYEYFVVANLYLDTGLVYYGELTRCYS